MLEAPYNYSIIHSSSWKKRTKTKQPRKQFSTAIELRKASTDGKYGAFENPENSQQISSADSLKNGRVFINKQRHKVSQKYNRGKVSF